MCGVQILERNREVAGVRERKSALFWLLPSLAGSEELWSCDRVAYVYGGGWGGGMAQSAEAGLSARFAEGAEAVNHVRLSSKQRARGVLRGHFFGGRLTKQSNTRSRSVSDKGSRFKKMIKGNHIRPSLRWACNK